MREKKKKTDEKTYFYYARDDENRPVITVCLIVGEHGVGRGIAVCSINDNPEKVVGRDIAKRRALKAYWKRMNGIQAWSANVLNVLDSIRTGYLWLERCKIEFNPDLTAHEIRMLKITEDLS